MLDEEGDGVAPLADGAVVDAVDGFVGPLGRGGGEGMGVDVVGGGVVGEQDEAFAVGVVDLDLALVEEGGVFAPAPADEDFVAADGGGDDRLDGGEIRGGDVFGDDAEGVAHGFVIGGVGLDEVAEGAEAGLDAGEDGGDAEGEGGEFGFGGGGIASAAGGVTPGGPLGAGVAIDVENADDVAEVGGVLFVGDYNVSELIPITGIQLGANAGVGPTFNQVFGWETGPNSLRYAVNVSGTLTGTASAFPATSTSASLPFFFRLLNGSQLALPAGSSPVGTVDNTAFFAGHTLASLGMVAGESVTITWNGGSAVIQTFPVPEPGSALLMLLGAGSATVVRRRRR